MDINKLLADIETRAADLVKARTSEIEETEGKIAGYRVTIEEAEKDLDAATTAEDLGAYSKANNKKRMAQDAQEMNERKLKRLKEKPFISPAEYGKLVSEIQAATKAEAEKAISEYIDHVDAMAATAEHLEKIQTRANDTLYKLQHDLYLDLDCNKAGKNNDLVLSQDRKKVDFLSDLVIWGYSGRNSAAYSAHKAEKE